MFIKCFAKHDLKHPLLFPIIGLTRLKDLQYSIIIYSVI